MRVIIHICGTSHSGKTYLREEFLKEPNCFHWDIQTWYKQNNIIVDNKMDWDAFREKAPISWTDFLDTIQRTSADIIFLETSGTNQLFNQRLSITLVSIPIIHIPLKTPMLPDPEGKEYKTKVDDRKLKEFANKRNELKPIEVMQWARMHERKIEIDHGEEFTIEEAGMYIQEIIKYVRKKNGKAN